MAGYEIKNALPLYHYYYHYYHYYTFWESADKCFHLTANGEEDSTTTAPATAGAETDTEKKVEEATETKPEQPKYAAEGLMDRIKDADVNWGYAQIIAGALLIGVAAVWYVKRRSVREVRKPME